MVNVYSQEAYKFSFSRRDDWHGPFNYYRNVNLAEAFMSEEETEESEAPVQVEVLIITGNTDPNISIDVISQTAQLVQR